MNLNVEHLHIEYPERLLFEDLNLLVEPGTLIGIQTAVLDGATSLLKGIAGMLNNIDGRVNLFDSNVLTMSDDARAKQIGFVYEEHGLISLYNVFQNIALPLEFHTDLSPAKTRALIDETFADLQLSSSLLKAQPQDLNDVQARMVNLARALVIEPKLLLIDELEGGMPDEKIDETMALLNHKKSQTDMIIMMTSSNEHVLREADRVLKIDNYQLIEISF